MKGWKHSLLGVLAWLVWIAALAAAILSQSAGDKTPPAPPTIRGAHDTLTRNAASSHTFNRGR